MPLAEAVWPDLRRIQLSGRTGLSSLDVLVHPCSPECISEPRTVVFGLGFNFSDDVSPLSFLSRPPLQPAEQTQIFTVGALG